MGEMSIRAGTARRQRDRQQFGMDFGAVHRLDHLRRAQAEPGVADVEGGEFDRLALGGAVRTDRRVDRGAGAFSLSPHSVSSVTIAIATSPSRRPTKPTRASKERRLAGKSRDARTKKLRSRVRGED